MKSKHILSEMGKRYPQIGPTVIMTWEKGVNGIASLAYLKGLIDGNKISIVFLHPEIVDAVIVSGQWETDQNRHIEARFPLGIALRDEFSLDMLSSVGLESINLVNKNHLNALMTRRQKIQLEVSEKLMRGCLTKDIIKAAEEWGIAINATLDVTMKELPGVKFSFIFDGKVVFEILLDAWSGCIIMDGEIPPIGRPNVFVDNEQVQGILLRGIDVCLARITA